MPKHFCLKRQPPTGQIQNPFRKIHWVCQLLIFSCQLLILLVKGLRQLLNKHHRMRDCNAVFLFDLNAPLQSTSVTPRLWRCTTHTRSTHFIAVADISWVLCNSATLHQDAWKRGVKAEIKLFTMKPKSQEQQKRTRKWTESLVTSINLNNL